RGERHGERQAGGARFEDPNPQRSADPRQSRRVCRQGHRFAQVGQASWPVHPNATWASLLPLPPTRSCVLCAYLSASASLREVVFLCSSGFAELRRPALTAPLKSPPARGIASRSPPRPPAVRQTASALHGRALL